MQGVSQYRRPLLVTIFVLLLVGVPSHAALTLAAPVAVQAQREHPTLTLGSSGTDVSELQTLLNTWIGNHPESGLAQLPVSGYFGSLTDQAVRTFQQAQGLPAQGIVGPLTWAALGGGESAAPAPVAPSLPAPELNGRGPVLPRGALTRRPWMVMIDNHPDAYPQSGMDKAAIVFEGLAEYGITRYIATYAEGWTPEVQQIGPVRSTRSYFAQWAEAFHPVYVHAGGSPDGLALVQSTDQLINFEALNQPDYSYRDTTRVAPHNLYTTSALLRQFAQDQGVRSFADASVGYLYATPAPLAQPTATALNYYFLDQGSAAGFVYSSRQNAYYRSIFGQAHVDRITGAQLWTNNVVVMAVTGAKRPDDAKARIDQNVIGSGPAKIFKDGGMINATWVKNSAAGQLRFYDTAGNEIVFSRGSIWIAAIPSLDRLTVR